MLNKHTGFNSSELNNFFFSKVNNLFSFLKNEISFERISWFHFLIILNVILLSTSLGLTGNNPNFKKWNLGVLTIDSKSNLESKKTIKDKVSLENWLTKENATAENLPSLIRQKRRIKKENIESLMLPPVNGCPNIQIVDLRETPGFPQTDLLNVCGDPDTLSMVIFTDEPGEIKGFEMTLNMVSGMRYAGFEDVHYGGGCTSISNSDPNASSPSFIANGITCGDVFVANIGVTADCSVDLINSAYLLEIEYSYTWFPPSGPPVPCTGTYTIENDFNGAMRVPVLNMFNPAPVDAVISTLSAPACQTVYVSQDGLGASLNEMDFELSGLDLGPGSLASVSSLTANGIDVLPISTYDATDSTLSLTLDSIHFVGNLFPNPSDGRMDADERVTMVICYNVDDCPIGENSFPLNYSASYGCFDETCYITNKGSFLKINPSGSLSPTISATLVNGVTICGPDALVSATFENPNTNTDQNAYTDLHIGFQACGMEQFAITDVTVNGVSVPAVYEIIGDDIDIDLSQNTDPAIGLVDYDGDGFLDDLAGSSGPIAVTVSFGLACGVGADGGCQEINCDNVQFYLSGKTDCGSPFQGFPPTGGFNLQYGQEEVSNYNEVPFNSSGSVVGYNFGTFSNDGAPLAGTNSSTIDVEFGYRFAQQNISDCPSGGETKMVAYFAGKDIIIQDLEVVPGSVIMVDGITGVTTAVPDSDVSLTLTSDATATLEINAGNNSDSLYYKYTLRLDECSCLPNQYISVDQQIVSVCSDCTPDCEIVKGCRPTLLAANPECTPCDCIAEYFPTRTERKNFGYTDKTMTTKMTRADVLAANALDLNRFMPGDTLWHQGYWEIYDEDIVTRDPMRWLFAFRPQTLAGSGTSGPVQAALPLTWDGGAIKLNELRIENPDGTNHVVDLSQLDGCATGGTSGYYNSFSSHFDTPWDDHPGNQITSTFPCAYSAWEGYDHNYTQIDFWNYDRMEEVNSVNPSIATRHPWGEGDCVNQLIETYNIVGGSKIHFDWEVPLIKNPLREQAKIIALNDPGFTVPAEQSTARIIPLFYVYEADEVAGSSTWGMGPVNQGCQQNPTFNISCPGGLKSETNIILDNCGGTIEHEFVIEDFAGPPGDEWFTHEYRPLLEIHDIELPIYSPLAYCANAMVEQNGVFTPVTVDSTVEMKCSPVAGYSDVLCSVDSLSEGAIIFDLYEKGFKGLGIGLDNCDTIRLTYDYCMICPSPINGILDYNIKVDWCTKGLPTDCAIGAMTYYMPGAAQANNSLADEAQAAGFAAAHNVNHYNLFNLDTLFCKIDDTEGIVFVDDSAVNPTAPLAITNQGPNVIASDAVGSSVEIQPIQVCNNDPTTQLGLVGYVTTPNPVQFVDAYSDAAGTTPLISTLVSDDGQIKKYAITLPTGSLALGECTTFYIGTTFLYCPPPGSLPPEVCAGASAGCSPEAVRAAIGAGGNACDGSETCYVYLFGEADLQTEWWGMPNAPALCDTFTLNVRVKNVKDLLLLNLDPMFDIPAGLAVVPGSWEVAYPGGSVGTSGNFGTWNAVVDPNIVSGNTFKWTDDALWNTHIHLNGMPGVTTTLDSNKVSYRFKVVTSCDEFLSGDRAKTETLASDPCSPGNLSSGLVESPQIIINGADPADNAQLLTVANPKQLFCGGLTNTFGLSALNISDYPTTDSVVLCLNIPTADLNYIPGSTQFTNGFTPAWMTENIVGPYMEVCLHAPTIPVGGSWTVTFEAEMINSASCGDIEVGADIKSVVENMACSSGTPPACDVFVQNSINPGIFLQFKPPLETVEQRVSADCSAGDDPVQVCYEIDLTNPGPDYNGNVRVGIHDDVTGNSILDSYDAELNGMDHAVSILNGDTVTITACLDVAAIQSCPIILKTTYETACSCDSEEIPYQTLPPTFIAELEDCTVLCPSNSLDLATCGNFTVTLDPAAGGTIVDDGMGNLSITINPGYGETTPINMTVTGTQGECPVSETKQLKSSGSWVPSDLTAEICEDQCLDLDLLIPANLEDGATITWTPSTGLSDPTSATPEVCNLTDTIVYNVEIKFGDLCIYNIDYTVNYNPINDLVITANEFCLGYEKGILTAPTGYATYEWYSLQSGFEILEAVTTTNTWNGPSVGGDYFLKAFLNGVLCPTVSNIVTLNPPDCVDLEITKSFCPTPVNPGIGDTVTYCIEICNRLNPDSGLIHDANLVEVEDSWPTNLNYVNYTTTYGSYIYNTPAGTWSVGTLVAGQCETLTLWGTIIGGGKIENIAEITAQDITDVDSSPGNDDGDQSEDDEDIQEFEVILADIGNSVWVDANGDGIQDPSELPVENVEVVLYDSNTGLPIDTVYTDANGEYLFEDLPSGDYYITFDPSTSTTPGAEDYPFTNPGQGNGSNDSEADATGQTPSFSFDATMGDDLTHDAGLIPVADIGNYVWVDTDGDGIQDPSEAGVANAMVILYDDMGNPLDTAFTDANGAYLFEDLPAGDYSISIDPSTSPGGQDYVFTDQDTGDGTNDSDADATGTIPLFSFDPTTGDDLTLDAGLVPVADIGNYVWADADGDGIQDPGESGIENVEVVLYDANTGQPLDTVYTDANGNYLFEDVPEGDYYVGFDLSSSTDPDVQDDSFSPSNTGNGVNDSDADASGFTSTFNLDPTNGDNLTIDAGVVPTADIGNYVFIDNNGDGLQDGTDTPVEGVTVTLYDSNTGLPVATVMTDANGMYLFEDMPSGDYYIEFDQSTSTTPGASSYGFTSAGSGNGADDSEADANGQSPTFSFDASMGDDLTHDAGLLPVADIGNYVWIDTNGDGIQDPSELGVENVTVTLYDNTTGLAVATVMTDANGEYLFEDVLAGDYYIEFDASTAVGVNDYEFTSQGSGNGADDSEADASGTTPVFSFDPVNGDDMTHDAGIVPVADIGDLLWVDTDMDGIQDIGEAGVAGATVTLYDANTGLPVATVMTDANGNYLFEDQPYGDYYVEFDLSTAAGYENYGFTQSGTGTGANDSEANSNGQTPTFTFDPLNGDDLTHDAGIIPPTDLAIDKMVDNANPAIGDIITFTIVVENQGPTDATGIEVTDQLPSGFLYVNDNSGGTYDPVTGIWMVGNLANGNTASLNIAVEVLPGGSYINYTEISSMDGNDIDSNPNSSHGTDDNGDGLPDDDEDSVEIQPGAIFDLALDKTLAIGQSSQVNLGDDVEYLITVTNEGDIDATDVTIVDYIPAGSILSPNDTNGWTSTSASTAELIISGPLTPGNSISVNIMLKILYGASDSTLTNTAEITDTYDGDGNPITDNDSEPDNNDPGEDDIETETVTLLMHDPTGYIYCDKTGYIVTGGTITVTGPNGIPNDEVIIVKDGSDGSYEYFEIGLPGVYTITYNHPSGVTLSTTYLPQPGPYDVTSGPDPTILGSDSLGGFLIDTAQASNPYYLEFDVEPGDPYVFLNNLPVRCVFIGDIVCEDTDANNTEDGTEPGMANVIVRLADCSDTTVILRETMTDGMGNYRFDGLMPGSYAVQFLSPNGYAPVNGNTLDENGFAPCTTLDWGECDTTISVCFTLLADIGNFVWVDADGDGVQDVGEAGVPNVEVVLFDANTGLPVDTVYTDSNGEYLFEDVPGGDYYITFDPSGSGVGDYEFTSQNTGNAASDSDANDMGQTANFNFNPNDGDDMTIDAGIIPVADIGNYVWIDADGDGVQDPGETPVEGATVTLYDTNTGAVIATVMTDASGEYLFEDVPAGDYYIGFDQSTSTTPGAANYPFTDTNTGNGANDSDADATGFTSSFVFDPSTGDDLTWDAGLLPVANIGDYVWLDNNGDGLQDATDTPVEGATVTLYDANTGLPVATTTTDATGAYLFEDVPSGDYYIEFDASTSTTPGAPDYPFTSQDSGDGTNDSEANTSGQTPTFAFDATTGDDMTHDAGLLPSADIGNFVWVDSDGDGLQDPSEMGIENVTVILYDAGGLPIDTVYTDANGEYLFEDVPAGTYTIGFDPTTSPGTSDFLFTDQDTGGDGVDSDANASGLTDPFVFDPANGDDLTIDAGVVPVADIGNYVWIDADGDGIQDVGETPVEGATVTLYDANTGAVVATVMTDASGEYLFEDVPEGDYYIEFDQSTSTTPAAADYPFTNTNTGNGSNDSDADASGATATFSFDPNTGDDLTWDAGLLPVADIGDYVWIDNNGDGLQDGTDTPVEGVTVTLYDSNTGAVIATTTTDANGEYLFEDVPSGDYYIDFDASTSTTPGAADFGWVDAGAGDGTNDSEVNSSGSTPPFTFDASTGDDLTHDAGLQPVADIGNFVWVDTDGDGLQDPSEMGIENVTVILYDAGGLPIDTVYTDANGEYLFEDVPAGTYTVGFDPSTASGGADYLFTAQDAGGDGSDSDADASGQTAPFVFDPTTGDDLTIDAGVVPVADIGNFVWVDSDGDGIQDPSEVGVPGVTVTLYDSNTGAVIATVMTDASGEYLFEDVPEGDYYINFDPSTNTAGIDYPFTDTNTGNGSDDSDANASGSTASFSFDPNTGDDLTWDAGLVPVADIGDYVFIDNNGDGLQDATDTPVENVMVILYDANTGNPLDTVYTDASGMYVFEDTPSGDYFIGFDPSTSTTAGAADFPWTEQGAGDGTNDSEVGAAGTTPSFTFDAESGDDNTHDAGLLPVADIGNFVWVDSDGDGLQDSNEAGVENVMVVLFDDNTGLPVDTVFTDANGEYVFEDVPAGSYHIEFDPSATGGMYNFTDQGTGNGANDSEADAAGVTPGFVFDPANGDDMTHDAGIVPVSGIGDFVWIDSDGDGIQDPGEVGVENVQVVLYDALTGMPLDTVYTDANGEYLFTDVPAGDYYIGFDPSTNTSGIDYPFTESGQGNGTNDSEADANGFTPAFSFDPASGEDLTHDAGLVPVADIGDYVFIDNNGDGLQDATDTPVEGVTVTLFDSNTGLPVATVMTDASGNYLFEDVPSGDYYIEFDASTSTTPGASDYGWAEAGQGDGTNDSEVDPSGSTPSFSFDAESGDDLTHDAGLTPVADIGNFVWIDSDGDGLQDPSEVGIENVTVILYDNSGNPVDTAYTDANGEYVFEDVPAGDYYLVFDPSTAPGAPEYLFTDSAQGDGTNDSEADATGQTPLFTFDPANGDDDTHDAGLVPVADIGNFVWVDADGDGIQDPGEVGLENVQVVLYDATTGLPIDTVYTDADGEYLFEDVPAGDYFVGFDPSTSPTSGANFLFTDSDTGNGSNDSDADASGFTSTISFDPMNGSDLTIDAGVVPSANIGDLVWVDSDGDGIQDPGESGVEGVTVILYDADTGLPVDTVMTDVNGNYLFTDVPSGNYYIEFDATTGPYGDEFTYAPFHTGLPGEDSDADANGNSPVFAFDAFAGDKMTCDAGIIPTPEIRTIKNVLNTNTLASGNVEITFELGVKNTGPVDLTNISLIDDLVGQLGATYNGIAFPPTVTLVASTATSTPALNGTFDGMGNNDIFAGAATDLLEPGQEVKVNVTITIDPDLAVYPMTNQANAAGDGLDDDGNPLEDGSGNPLTVTDDSDAGTDYEGTNPGVPGDQGTEDDPTILDCFPSNLVITGEPNGICPSENVTLSVTSDIPGATYEWREVGSTVIISTDANPTFFNLQDTTYYEVTVIKWNRNLLLCFTGYDSYQCIRSTNSFPRCDLQFKYRLFSF